jgi:hypothetical protein
MLREPLFCIDVILADCLVLKSSTAEFLAEVMLHARSSVNIFLHCPENINIIIIIIIIICGVGLSP